jgi:hypothetical protein
MQKEGEPRCGQLGALRRVVHAFKAGRKAFLPFELSTCAKRTDFADVDL